jgi:aerobic-type carbon monoxide dehydrogenase small subunit (CoxS/CutS family)
LTSHVNTAHPADVVAVPEKLTKLIVNGETHELKVEVNWTLNFVLREKLGLTGTKIWCEEGSCGACTVLMDGAPIFSCMTLATECEGKNIETIEGLSDGVTLHPIQQAFIDNFGLQCGYCTPGIILVTKALLSEDPNPTVEDIREALAGNICKCGDYKQIIASVLAVAAK